uniref:CG5039-like protein n=1 Tax=Drosophila buzzatii TaxID=7264 RepID=I3RSE4_DROBU|nr:CG5039-like protein [Drosophila buzzatii]
MDIGAITTVSPDLEHPDDAQYIWLPILVLVGVALLAGLVYAMSRSRRPFNLICFKRRNATRNGYTNVDDDSDVSMAGADEPNAITSLLDARLHIEPLQRTGSYAQSNQVHLDANDIALRV